MSLSRAENLTTRLVDLSTLTLADLDRCDQAELAAVIDPLVREVSSSIVVSLAGSDS